MQFDVDIELVDIALVSDAAFESPAAFISPLNYIKFHHKIQ